MGLGIVAYTPVNRYSGLIDGQAENDYEHDLYLEKAREFDEKEKIDKWDGSDKSKDCQTCANRRYQDSSDDPGVSFKSPTKISPDAAASAVRSHENEHVVNEQANANRKGGEVISQSVAIFTSVCPECKKVYVSGGETRTAVRYGADGKFEADSDSDIGKVLDKSA